MSALFQSNISDAISRSIQQNEIAKVEVVWPEDARTAEEAVMDVLDVLGADDADVVGTNDGLGYDAWGTLDGEDFRIRIWTR